MSLYSQDLDPAIATRRPLDFVTLVAALGAAQAVSRTAMCAAAIATRVRPASPRDAMIGLLSARSGWASCAALLGHSFDNGTASMLSATPRKGL